MVDPTPLPPVAPAGVPGAVPGPVTGPVPGTQPGPPTPPDPTAALSLRGLWKRFGEKIAVAGIDLDVPAGSFYGLVGPNGAGKTTTLSMATGLLRPDAGSAHVHGTDLWADPDWIKQLIPIRDGLILALKTR